MKILTIPAYAFPEKVAGSHLTIDRNEAIINSGIDIMVLVPTPCRGVSKEEIDKYSRIKWEEKYDGRLRIRRFKMFQEGKNPVLRAARYSLCWLSQLFIPLFGPGYDMVLIGSTPPIQGLIGAVLRRLRRMPYVYILQDIFPDSLAGTGLAKRDGLLWKIGRVVENITYRNADKIIVISDDFKKNIMAKGVPEEKIVVVYNWVDEKAVIPIAKEDNILYDELGIDREKFSVVYAGNFGHAQNIDVTIAAAERLKDVDDIQFLMFGTGGLVDDYKKVVQEKGLKNVFFYPLQPSNKVSYVYSLGDLGVVACKKGLGKGAFPSKTWSIMATGTPVLANYDDDTDLERLIKENRLGVFSEADDQDAMAEAILGMYNNRELCSEYGKNARRYIEENVSKDKSTQKYVDVIKEVVENRKRNK